jgi:hypothetical protein
MRRQQLIPWPRIVATRGRSCCHLCHEARDLSEFRLVHVAGRSSGVYVCRPDLAAPFCLAWQAGATREGISDPPPAAPAINSRPSEGRDAKGSAGTARPGTGRAADRTGNDPTQRSA